jgi:hypothetical protein
LKNKFPTKIINHQNLVSYKFDMIKNAYNWEQKLCYHIINITTPWLSKKSNYQMMHYYKSKFEILNSYASKQTCPLMMNGNIQIFV